MTGPRLSIIPARACTDPALKPRDLQVLCVLGRHTDDLGWCRKSQVKMAQEMSCGRATVFESIGRLVEAGYLERHVQVEENGRDSPHVFRVILDPKHPDPGSIPAEADPENGPENAAHTGAPPAGIPAPPAGPGPAPKNDSSRTIERDARATPENREPAEDPKKVEAEGWALLKQWPGFDGMPKERAMAEWRGMPASDRATARRRFLPWLELLRKQKKSHVPSPRTYLRERLFEAVADPQDAPAPPPVAAPFGKLWGAVRLTKLLAGPGPLPRPSSFIAQQIAQGGASGERERLRHQAINGWRQVNRMHEWADNRRGWTVSPDELGAEAFVPLFDKVRVGSDLWLAWQALHEARGWPWLPDPGAQEWVYFPASGPDRFEEFERAVRELANEKKDNDAVRPEAAE